ncbi:d-4,5 unsaturated -glucuronyl hydrolase-like protein [Rhizoctonia solani AG-1 IA]|uniref:D-4,5 unsaturated-glucuronyl hydrolase-like protein n=1 Tax=Thanatephorus cucumeris (strain AG1-IA) TaxID=983506 RepID=L8WZP2_THACA|nr:d-4,5 unsaturated -glucuronyl hydrolase-like protein [Rhizoctonia solani AG-1 IA]
MQYHSLYEPYQLPHGEWTSLHLTWLRMPVPRSSHFSPWRLVCSHHIHDGGLRAQYKAYGEFRLSQQSQHIRELASHNFICEMPPCSCKAKGLDISELYSEGYNQSDIPQWGDIGRNSTTRRHRKRPTFATRTYCPNPNLKQQSGTHSYIPPDSTPTDNANRPQSRAPPPQPHSQRPTSRQAAQAWSNYKERCHAMCNLPQQADPGTRYLTFSSIPWPVFGAVNIISDLHAEAIKEFLCPPNCDRREQRARVKSALLVFHPDKSAARWISFLRHDDIPTVHSALNIFDCIGAYSLGPVTSGPHQWLCLKRVRSGARGLSCRMTTMIVLKTAFLVAAASSGITFVEAANGVALDSAPPSQLISPLIESKLTSTAGSLSSNNPTTYPQWTYLSGNGTWQYFRAATWTSGFFPASLYLMNTRKSVLCTNDSETGSTDWLAAAQSWMQGLDPVANSNAGLFDGVRHDVGFLSFGWLEALTLNSNDDKAKAAINSYATYLASRFNPNVGCTMSWDPPSSDPTQFLHWTSKLLIVASKLTGNSTLYNMATSHANKTMVNHLRPDASTYHVVNYNQTTGAVIWQRTAQGYADNRTRGQAWGIHGFATSKDVKATKVMWHTDEFLPVYNYTGDSNYWITSRRLAEYYLSRLPESGVPPWDFDAPAVPGRPSDTSSATIAASGMLMLSRFEQSVSNTTGASYWANAAVRLLSSTTNLAWREESNWQSLLSNGTVNNPANPPNNNTGIIYGDYYYIKAGNELLNQGLMNCSNGQAATPALTSPNTPQTTQQTNGGVPLISAFWTLIGLCSLLNFLILYCKCRSRKPKMLDYRPACEHIATRTLRQTRIKMAISGITLQQSAKA